MPQTKITALLLSAALFMFVPAGVMAQAPAPYTTATPPATAPVAVQPVEPVATTPVTPAVAATPAQVEALALKDKIKRCAELQDRSVRMTCYDNTAADLGFISPDRVKNDEAQLQKIGFWQVSEKTGADGVSATYLRIESSNQIEARNGTERQVALVIKCTLGKTDAFLDWKAPVVGGIRASTATALLVNYYTNNNQRMTENWEISTDKQALFSPDAVAFVRNLMKSTKLTLEFVPEGSAVQAANFDTRGIDEAIDTIVKNCYPPKVPNPATAQ